MSTPIAAIAFGLRRKVHLQFFAQAENNLVITMSDSNEEPLVVAMTLSFREFITWIYSSKQLWVSTFTHLISDSSRFGMQHVTAGRFANQIYLNWFGLPKTIDEIKALGLPNTMEEFDALEYSKMSPKAQFSLYYMCNPDEHKPDEETYICYKCGMYKNPDEEEDAAALLCDCGYPEEECECPGCDFCGEKDEDCKCLICDDCGFCKCTNKSHQRKHKLEPCEHEPKCIGKERKKQHKRLSCICKSKICEDCGLVECECESEEEYWC